MHCTCLPCLPLATVNFLSVVCSLLSASSQNCYPRKQRMQRRGRRRHQWPRLSVLIAHAPHLQDEEEPSCGPAVTSSASLAGFVARVAGEWGLLSVDSRVEGRTRRGDRDDAKSQYENLGVTYSCASETSPVRALNPMYGLSGS